jgi:hypothetical protein
LEVYGIITENTPQKDCEDTGLLGKSAKYRIIIYLAVLLVVALAVPVLAAATNDAVLKANEVRTGPVFLTGQTVTVAGTVNGDLYVVARQVRIDGTIQGDLFIGAEKAVINGSVEGDIRTLSVDATLSGPCKGSMSVWGDTLWIWREGSVGRGLFIGTSAAQINGAVAEGIKGSSDTAYINSSIGGAIDVRAEKRLTLGPLAAVGGKLSYRSENPARIDPDAVIKGETKYTRVTPEKSTGFSTMGFLMSWWSSFLVWWVFSLLVPRMWRSWGHSLAVKPWVSLATGLLAVFVVPAFLFLLMISLVGVPAGLILGLAAAAVAYLGRIVVAVALSRYAMRNWRVSEMAAVLILLMPVALMLSLPGFGLFFFGLFACLGLGSLVLLLGNLRRSDRADSGISGQ